jgi:hypothetical protein
MFVAGAVLVVTPIQWGKLCGVALSGLMMGNYMNKMETQQERGLPVRVGETA